MELASPEEEFVRVSDLLLKKGVKLRDVYPMSLIRMLGDRGATATVVFLGEDAFSDPRILLQRAKRMFGNGTPVILADLIHRANEMLGSGS